MLYTYTVLRVVCTINILYFIYAIVIGRSENDHILGKAPEPIPNSEAKPVQARLVLPWGTRWESRVSFSFLVPGFGIPGSMPMVFYVLIYIIFFKCRFTLHLCTVVLVLPYGHTGTRYEGFNNLPNFSTVPVWYIILLARTLGH